MQYTAEVYYRTNKKATNIFPVNIGGFTSCR